MLKKKEVCRRSITEKLRVRCLWPWCEVGLVRALPSLLTWRMNCLLLNAMETPRHACTKNLALFATILLKLSFLLCIFYLFLLFGKEIETGGKRMKMKIPETVPEREAWWQTETRKDWGGCCRWARLGQCSREEGHLFRATIAWLEWGTRNGGTVLEHLVLLSANGFKAERGRRHRGAKQHGV